MEHLVAPMGCFASEARLLNQNPGNHPKFGGRCSRSEKAILRATLGIPGPSRSDSQGKQNTTTVETSFASFAVSEASMVYTILSGTMVYTLFPSFSKETVPLTQIALQN